MNDRLIKIAVYLLRFGLAAVFIYASVEKIQDPAGFAAAIDNYRMLPYPLIALMAAVLPWLEFACGVALLLGRWQAGAALLMIIMNGVFIIAIATAMARGLDISCGCFTTSAAGARVGAQKLLEDVGLLLGALFLYTNHTKTG